LSGPRFLVLANAGDALAGRVAVGMRQAAGPGAHVLWLTPTDLVLGRWEHRVSSAGVRTWLQVDGEWRGLDDVAATLNRLRWLPPVAGGFASTDDADYASAERHALVTSAVHGLAGTVVNPPTPPSLSGPDLTSAGWLRLAASLGLAVRGTVATTDARRHPRPGWQPARWPSLVPVPTTVPLGARPVVWMAPVTAPRRCWVVGESVIVSEGTGCRAGGLDLRRLARAAGCLLLEVLLARDDRGEVVLAGADPFPVDVPDEVLDAVLDLLLARVGSR